MAVADPEPIAVIGMACRFPGGSDSPSKLWDLLQSPRDLSKRVPTDRYDTVGFYHTNGSHHGATDATNAYFLEEDVGRFDNTFFNIQPAEAEAIDPQQRLIMETVYDSLSAGGQPIENLRGSNTAIYVGMMCDDWSQLVNRDWDLMPTYAATGESRAIISNRVSYFFDWHGPSMTIDTACSSSLVAVHQAVTALRNGECSVAIAAGANLILGPGMFIAESNLHMLSPTGSSKMWDAAADGYARGEGIASIVLKPLSAALRDGDHVDCIIRETAVNQDGKTAGLTMPSNIAQADLIRKTYARAGLNINDPKDRPQFFHAHGTGTPAGDPQEAEAISQSFFGDGKVTDKLHVGSIKTVIGHTEGAAGLASLIGSVMAMQRGIIPPNLHFKNLSDRVAPFFTHLNIPTTAIPWPSTLSGQPRRVSVNSFGFGGTNAHAILEYFEPELPKKKSITAAAAVPSFTPLTVSAGSSYTLRAMLDDLRTYLKANPDTNIRDLAYTLQVRRSTLAFRKPIIATSIEQAIKRIDGLLADDNNDSDNGLNNRYYDVSKPNILGVFTGQGAQWPRMGARLIEESPFAAQRIAELQRALATLPEGDRPDWTLSSQLLAYSKSSRLAEAAIAQPLCTAVQIVLVDLLRASGIELRAVVGHSSGEIAAAYAAGFLSATDGIRIAYYRGFYAKLSRVGVPGAMIAVGTSFEDAEAFCELEDFAGRIQVAARNSSTSVTLSGDKDAIEEAEAIFKDEGKFARQLRVDTAYHSTHMLPCAEPYLAGLARAGYTVGEGNGTTTWFSSVIEGGHIMTKEDVQKIQYWIDNMTNAVLFEPAISEAVAEAGPFNIAIEFGPHPALKGPALDTIEHAARHQIPYTGLLARGKDDVEELASALGYLWMQLGASSVDFDEFEKLTSGAGLLPKRTVADLPTYPFDHSRSFYSLTRFSGGHRHLQAPPHPLLGRRLVETETADEISWRNVLRPTENSWLQGHALQGQSVFPAMGYVSMAVEAVAAVATNCKLGQIALGDVVIARALAFDDENAGMETKLTLSMVRSSNDELSARITCHSGLPFDSATPLVLNFSATIHAVFHEPEPDTLPVAHYDEINLVKAETERFYSQFTKLGYNYSSPFTGVRSIQRKMGWATGEIEDESGDAWEDKLLVHPGWLDSAIQTGFAAYSHPHDNRLFTLSVPTAIRSVVINPYFFDTSATRVRSLQFQTSSREAPGGHILVDIDIFAGDSAQVHPFVQFESVEIRPFAEPTPRDDAVIYTRYHYRLSLPNVTEAEEGNSEENDGGSVLSPEHDAALEAAERVGFFYLRRLHETITRRERAEALNEFQHLLYFADRAVKAVSQGKHPYVPREAFKDSLAFVRSLIFKYHTRDYMRLLEVAGDHLADSIRGGGSILEHLNKDGLLTQFYQELTAQPGQESANMWYARVVAQITFRFPRAHILEIGGGTGAGSTAMILPELGDAFSTYTYTAVSAESFENAQDRFRDLHGRLLFATYDINQPPAEQGLEEGTYDIVLASVTLHTADSLDKTLANARKLLRPGGYLVALEINTNESLSLGTILGGLPGWWAGATAADPSRSNGPSLSLDQWDVLTRQHGFGGIDSYTPSTINNDKNKKMQWFSVFVSQAVDDRINSLRAPLDTPAPTQSTSQLVVVGGRTAAVARLAEEALAVLGPRYAAVTRLESLEELNEHGLASGSSVLSLTELDEQFLEVRTESKIEALKTLWRNGGSILWVTRTARAECPFSSMILGLSRLLPHEYPTINLQLLDFDAATEATPQVVAEALVRLEFGVQFKKEEGGTDLLWTIEPEYHYVDSRLLIPRLLPDTDANNRYNTYRRAVSDKFNLRKTLVMLEPAADGESFELANVSPIRVLSAPRTAGKRVTLQVEQSLLQVIKVREAGYFSLYVGTDAETGQRLVALSDAAVESQAHVPLEWTVRLSAGNDINIGTSLAAVAAHLLAQTMLATAPRSGTVLVHEADELLKDAIDKEASKEGVRVVFTTTAKKNKTGADFSSTYIFIHEKLPVCQARKLLPRDVSFVIDLSPKSAATSSGLFARSLSSHTASATTTAAHFLRTQPSLSPDADDVDLIGRALKAAWLAVTNRRRWASASIREQVPLLLLQDVTDSPAVHAKLSVVDWTTSSSVRALVRPIDYGTIFRADGTYLLVGLTGELGQSLCAWMVAHGARNVVLSSRRPKVDQRFIDSCAAEGATIKAMSIDVTRRESLRAALENIRAQLPPIIGVANGAMLIEDSLFDDMSFASLQRTAPPKIDGTIVLDEFFYDAPLDFFIAFTSLANVVGNTGQSAYIMENQFMAALMAQRRDVRGVAGSDMAISSIQGLGYFEHANHLDKDHFTRIGYRNVSEQDFLTLFAETVLAGRPGEKGTSEVCTGVSPFRDSAILLANPTFSHLLLHDAANPGGRSGGGGRIEAPRIRLGAVKSRPEALAIVQEAFITRLRRILMIPNGESVNEKTTLVEQGVDSIMAVEVRTWFLQEFNIDLPVLKILGAGSTVESLLDEAVDNIPTDILDLENLVSGDGAGAKSSEAAPAIATKALPSTELSTETATSSTGTDSPHATLTPHAPLDTPMESPLEISAQLADDFKHKIQAIQVLEKLEEARRKTIINSSFELIEPMTYGQKRFWFLNHYIDDRKTFNIAYQFRLIGHIRINDLAKAVESVAQRHEALRTRFFWSSDDSKMPMQGILSKGLVRLETATIESEAEAAEELDTMRDYEWNLGDWGQLRLRLLSLSDTVHYLLMGTHHISMDGHSMNMLMLDINQAYSDPHQTIGPLPDASQARAFGKQQLLAYKAGKLQPAIDYYRRTLESVDLTSPIELLPFARSQVRLPLECYEIHVARMSLDPQTAARLKQLARSNRATSFHGYLAALQALLFRLLPVDSAKKVVIGIADANRIDSKFMGSVGNFLNVLPLVFDRPSGGQTYSQAVEKARKKVYGALEHSALPFDLLLDELVVPRSNAYPPVCQVLMDYKLFTREQAEMSWAGCKVDEHRWHAARGAYDIAMEIVEDRKGALVVVHMQGALYSQEATDLFLRSYVNVLKEVTKQGGDKVKLEKLEKWDKADVKKALELGNGSDLQLEWPTTVAHRIDQVIAQYPDNVAVKDGFGHVLTYAALDERVESIVCTLRQKLTDQSREQSVVGIFQTPSAHWIASLIAILRIGAIYLPLDLKVSAPRLKSYVKMARPAAILADNEMVRRTNEIGIGVEDGVAVINVSDLPTTVDGSRERIATAAHHDRPAYIIFTSGSTGEPKGIVVKHASFRAMVEGFVREWEIATLGRVVLQQFALTSDGSLKQIASAITTGGCLVVAPADARGDPIELTRLMAEHGVTMTVATPSEYNMWFRFASDSLRRCTAWTSAWFGGERSPQSLLDSFRNLSKVLPNLRFFTTYGPTEATISTMKGVADVHNPNLTVPVPGRILPNYAVYIIDDESRPVPVGVPGEILIGGAGVGNNEYLNRPDVTSKQFLADPFTSHDKNANGWGRMYSTGDYGRLNARGLLAVEGRVAGDAQVKVRGFRVELAEIEGVIIREAAGTLAHAVVTLRAGEGDHDDFLAVHVVIENHKNKSKGQAANIVDQLRTRLSQSLPQYMIPAVVVPVDKLPLTAHNKVDRKAVQALPLPEIRMSAANQQELQKSFTPAERRLADLWASILPVHSLAAEPLTPQSDFFNAGGNSLLLVKLQSAIKSAFGDAPRLSTLMRTSELGSMAILLESEESAPNWDKEIALDIFDQVLEATQETRGSTSSSTRLRILVTGATGSLGKQTIHHLADDERVAQIIVLARPAEGRDLNNLFCGLESKVRVVSVELPFLPADNSAELAEIDVILHIAADRNFWDSYRALKPINVNTVKKLAKLALRTGATLHVLSSGAVADYEADGDNNILPRPDPAHGYVASKWVAERYLANAARQFGLQVTAHRPTKAAAVNNAPIDELTEMEDALVRSYLLNSSRLGVRPDFAQLGGTFHLAPLEDVATAIAAAVTSEPLETEEKSLRIINYPGTATIRTEVTSAYAEELFNLPENEALQKLPTVPALHWVGMAKRAKLFEWFITSQELVVTNDEGRRVVSTR